MLSNIHEGLKGPSEIIDSAIVRGRYLFYHYSVDGFDDRVCSFGMLLFCGVDSRSFRTVHDTTHQVLRYTSCETYGRTKFISCK